MNTICLLFKACTINLFLPIFLFLSTHAEMTRQSLEEAGDEEELAEFEDEDNIYSQVNIFFVASNCRIKIFISDETLS